MSWVMRSRNPKPALSFCKQHSGKAFSSAAGALYEDYRLDSIWRGF